MKGRTACAALGLALTITGTTAPAQEELDRTVLPIAEPKRPTYSELDARKARPPARFEVKAPEGAPNVLVVLVDDLGFAGTGTFGGPIRTPTFVQIANEGLHYNNFHTTAVCSPTRAALKSGRNHHVNNMGGIIETGTDKKVAEGRIERTQPMIFSADETADVGIDLATPVVEAIGIGVETRFTGRINKITLVVSPAN